MAWNPQGGGGGPWGGGGNGGGNGGGPWGRGPGGGGSGMPGGPDLEDLIRRGQEKLRRAMPGGGGSFAGGRGLLLVPLAVLVLWLASGIYRVNTDEQGVVMRFGRWVDTTEPGLHYRLPFPIDTVILPKVTKLNQLQLGFRAASDGRTDRSRDVPEESRMLTGDENIVEADFVVFWRIKDAGKFLFNLKDPEGTVKVAAESAMRDVVGRNPITFALSDRREQIAIEAQAELQKLLDSYEAGIHVQQVQLQGVEPPSAVIDAFNDVQRARADLERTRNEAEAYRNDIIPRARGEAERMLQEAEAYKEQVVNKAQGETKRFMALYTAYKQAEEVTSRRLYLETMEEILAKSPKMIVDPAKGSAGMVPYMQLEGLQPKKPAAAQGGAQ
ncbi:MAG: FtsH protease activity modulator HflK [Magnetospirillum sp.]|nr:MAG: FtsH protease activity modulator HflK [Magnetospirillum sp.]